MRYFYYGMRDAGIGILWGSFVCLMFITADIAPTPTPYNVVVTLALSAVMGFAALLYEIGDGSLVLKTGIHFIVIFICWYLMMQLNGWSKYIFIFNNPITIMINILVFVAIYGAIWIFSYLSSLYTQREINSLIDQRNHEKHMKNSD